MSRIALDGITLAVGKWPGPREAGTDRTVVCVHGLSANPEVTSALRVFLAGG